MKDILSKFKNGDIPEPNTIGSKENPFVCHILVARKMKKAFYIHDMWVSIPMSIGSKVCQLKDIE